MKKHNLIIIFIFFVFLLSGCKDSTTADVIPLVDNPNGAITNEAIFSIQIIDVEAPYLQLKSGYDSFDDVNLIYVVNSSSYSTIGELINDLHVIDNNDHNIDYTYANVTNSDNTTYRNNLQPIDFTIEHYITFTDSSNNQSTYTIIFK